MTMRSRGWLFALLALGACASAPVVPPTPAAAAAEPLPALAGTRWVGVVEGSVEGNARPRLEFAIGGELHGYTGCNMLSGHWSEAAGGEVRFVALMVTKRMCLGPGAEIEKRFLAAVSPQSRVAREPARLVVTSPQGARFEFTPAAAA